MRPSGFEVDKAGSGSLMDRRVPTDAGPKLLAASRWLLPVCCRWPLVRAAVEPCGERDSASGAEATLNGSVVLLPFWFSCFCPLLKKFA